jgi:hypothetical protein
MIGGMGGFILKRDQSFRELSRELIGTFEFGILLIALYFSIGLVINIVLPDRAFLIPQWILVVILMSLGYRVGQLLRLKNPTFIKRPYVFIAALFLLFFTVTGAGSALGEALAKVPLYQEYAALWDRRDEDIRTAVEQGEPSIIIPFLPNVWGVSTIDANAAEGTNIYAARYYGLESIRAVGIPIEESD